MTHHQLEPDPMLQAEMDFGSHEHETHEMGIGFALGLGLGILVGVGAGLLIAPRPGREMISQLEDKVSDLKARALDTRDMAAEKWEAAKERILEAISSGKTKAAELLSAPDQPHHEEIPNSENSETLSGNPNLQM